MFSGNFIFANDGRIFGDEFRPDHYTPKAELYTRDRAAFCQPLEGCKQVETMPGK